MRRRCNKKLFNNLYGNSKSSSVFGKVFWRENILKYSNSESREYYIDTISKSTKKIEWETLNS